MNTEQLKEQGSGFHLRRMAWLPILSKADGQRMGHGSLGFPKPLVILMMFHALVFATYQGPNDSLRFVGNDKIPPFISVQNGKPIGLVVDLAHAIAQKAHLSISIEAMDWPTAQSLVTIGKADALLQINPSPEREKLYDFSDALLESHFHIFRSSKHPEIQDLTSLFGKKVGVEDGGFPIQYLKKYDQIQVVVVPNWKAGFEMLNTGQIDAVFVDRRVGEYELYLNKISGVTVVGPPIITDYSRIAVRKGNSELLGRLNFGLKEIAHDGTRQRILKKWQAKEVVYFTKESVFDIILLAALVCMAVLIAITLRTVAQSRALRQARDTLEQRVTERTKDLRQSEERYRHLFNSLIEGFCIVEMVFDEAGRPVDYRFLEVNKTFEAQTGLHDAQGKLMRELAPQQEAYWYEIYGKIALMGEPAHFVNEAKALGRWFDVQAFRVGEEGSRKVAICFNDITEQKKAEEALKESKERFRSVLDDSRDFIYRANLQTGQYEYVSPSVKKVLGYTHKEFEAMDTQATMATVHPDDFAAMMAKIKRLEETGSAEMEYRIRNKQGEYRWVSNYLSVINDDSGRPLYRGGNVRDITERKLADERLAFKARLLSDVHEAVFSSDTNYRINYWNHAAGKMFGWKIEEALGKNSGELLKPKVEKSSRDTERSKLWSAGHWEGEVQYIRKDGTYFFTDVNSTLLKDADGKDTGQVVVARDITARKRAEEKLRKYAEELATVNKQLESYAYSISHDLRTPLRAMKAFSNFLMEDHAGKLDATAQEYLKRIMTGSDKMSDLIDDMLNFSKISRQEILLQDIDLSAIAEDVVNILRQGEPANKADAVIARDLKIRGDARLMEIVLSNLIGNAWKYSSTTPAAKIEFGAVEKDGRKIYFVRDNGVGFNMAFADKLFEPFRRLHTESEFPGTGIGLAIVKRVVEKHGGTIWAESEIGKGATFYFTLTVTIEKPREDKRW